MVSEGWESGAASLCSSASESILGCSVSVSGLHHLKTCLEGLKGLLPGSLMQQLAGCLIFHCMDLPVGLLGTWQLASPEQVNKDTEQDRVFYNLISEVA